MNQNQPDNDPRWEENKEVELQDVVLSNSWALQSVLEYLEEKEPGARQRIFEIYQVLQQQADQSKNKNNGHDDGDDLNQDEK